MSKGSKVRPGKGYADGFDRIFTTNDAVPPLICPACQEEICICQGTEDGPGQDDVDNQEGGNDN